LRFVVLSSGSKGNTTYVECGDTKILIDVGNRCKYIVDKLRSIGVDAKDIDAILLTHTHVDHIAGLKVFLNKFKTKVYLTEGMKKELDYVLNYQIISLGNFSLGDMNIDVLRTSHDAPDSVGYVLHNDGKSVVYITDTGYINQKYFSMLSNADAYILESNHDVEMLSNGKYPFHLRQRILSDKGHISNYDCAWYLSLFWGNRTKCIVLAHLSEENNTPELAYNTLSDKFAECNIKLPDKVIIAKQNEETEMVEV